MKRKIFVCVHWYLHFRHRGHVTSHSHSLSYPLSSFRIIAQTSVSSSTQNPPGGAFYLRIKSYAANHESPQVHDNSRHVSQHEDSQTPSNPPSHKSRFKNQHLNPRKTPLHFETPLPSSFNHTAMLSPVIKLSARARYAPFQHPNHKTPFCAPYGHRRAALKQPPPWPICPVSSCKLPTSQFRFILRFTSQSLSSAPHGTYMPPNPNYPGGTLSKFPKQVCDCTRTWIENHRVIGCAKDR